MSSAKMSDLCQTCSKAEHCLINRLRLKFRDHLRTMQSEASLNALKVKVSIAVNRCDQYEECEEAEEAQEAREAGGSRR